MIKSTGYWIFSLLVIIIIPFIGIFFVIYGLLANNDLPKYLNTKPNVEVNNTCDKEINDIDHEINKVNKEIILNRYKNNKITKDEYINELNNLNNKN